MKKGLRYALCILALVETVVGLFFICADFETYDVRVERKCKYRPYELEEGFVETSVSTFLVPKWFGSADLFASLEPGEAYRITTMRYLLSLKRIIKAEPIHEEEPNY